MLAEEVLGDIAAPPLQDPPKKKKNRRPKSKRGKVRCHQASLLLWLVTYLCRTNRLGSRSIMLMRQSQLKSTSLNRNYTMCELVYLAHDEYLLTSPCEDLDLSFSKRLNSSHGFETY
jgi:hypothetical protein